MPDGDGWHFYVQQADGQIRNFTVGIDDQDAAQLAIQGHVPNVNMLNFVSKMRANSDLIKKLGLDGGKVWNGSGWNRKIQFPSIRVRLTWAAITTR
jgi:hypothetical protein